MSEEKPRSRRFVLLDDADGDTVEDFAQQQDWPYLSETAEDLDEMLPRHVSWAIEPSATLHYMEDLISDLNYVMVIADDPGTVRGAVAVIEDGLPVWTLDGLAADVDALTNPADLALALVRLGMGAPVGYDDRVFRRIRNAMNSEARRVREAALWAVTYEAWPDYVGALQDVLSREPDHDLARTAHALLAEMGAGDGT
ncbi:hypothetical protein [Streptomyces litchfieldiae]|uniref:HEAT repeat domain-containing protein n=1 Tax=Streptomyces litchfieldiae TaxID=3075543 RepID=A0ABU2MMN6_9ACTN|nr:hypothetical protein [Streptomyces sp. DSM 44938]MDT0342872.1 hypothetical protein [Streptomyces sp. DSM 44938]